MISFPEAGYTPANLKRLIAAAGWRREDIANALGISLRGVHRWCVETVNRNHRDMPLASWRNLIQIIEEKTMISELQFVCSAATTFVRQTVPDWHTQLKAGQPVTSGIVGDSDIRVTLTPSSTTEGRATISWKGQTATVPYCIDTQLGGDEGYALCIGMTLFESRRMTVLVQDIERQRESLVEQYGCINEAADKALDLISRTAMSAPYRRRDI